MEVFIKFVYISLIGDGDILLLEMLLAHINETLRDLSELENIANN